MNGSDDTPMFETLMESLHREALDMEAENEDWVRAGIASVVLVAKKAGE